ncbi:sugar phosphate nucleotidyltransferase [candidate division KSB1 bacterium]
MTSFNPEKIDIAILCGGKGNRLKSVVNDKPKPMAEIAEEPFLNILIDYAVSFGFSRFILLTGFMRNFVKEYYQNKESDLTFLFSEEERPLGTGGAVKKAIPMISSDTVIVMNGDSFCPIDFEEFYKFHNKNKASISIALSNAEKGKDYGYVLLDKFNKVTAFNEKTEIGEHGYLNAGIYLMEKSVFKYMKSNKFSLEYDFFPDMIQYGIYGYVTGESFIDIGTPERFELAKRLLTKRKGIKNVEN